MFVHAKIETPPFSFGRLDGLGLALSPLTTSRKARTIADGPIGQRRGADALRGSLVAAIGLGVHACHMAPANLPSGMTVERLQGPPPRRRTPHPVPLSSFRDLGRSYPAKRAKRGGKEARWR